MDYFTIMADADDISLEGGQNLNEHRESDVNSDVITTGEANSGCSAECNKTNDDLRKTDNKQLKTKRPGGKGLYSYFQTDRGESSSLRGANPANKTGFKQRPEQRKQVNKHFCIY